MPIDFALTNYSDGTLTKLAKFTQTLRCQQRKQDEIMSKTVSILFDN